VTFVNKLLLAFATFILVAGNTANAQLWRYIGDSQEKEKAADRALKKEAFSVITKRTIAYGDTFSYEVMTYVIKSFDAKLAKIRLWEKPFYKHVFHIDLPDDKLIIPDFYSLVRVHHLSNDLLEIVYSPRGGSDDGYDNVLILGVNKNKFCIVMEILSVHEFDGPDEYGLYNLHLKLTGNSVDNYQLNINVRDLLKSNDKAKSYDHNSTFQLKFDKDQHIFYSINQNLDAYVYQEDTKPRKRHVKGVYPTINLGDDKYCYFNKKWYSVWQDQTTGKFTMLSYCGRSD